MPATLGSVANTLRDYAPEVTRPVGKALQEYLVLGRQLADGDMDKMLVLGAIMVRTNDHPEFQKLNMEEVMAGMNYPLPTRPVSVQSISKSTGIPRESVRRKVNDLIDQGWVEKVGTSHQIRLTPRGLLGLDPLTKALLNLIVKSTSAVQETLARHPSS